MPSSPLLAAVGGWLWLVIEFDGAAAAKDGYARAMRLTMLVLISSPSLGIGILALAGWAEEPVRTAGSRSRSAATLAMAAGT